MDKEANTHGFWPQCIESSSISTCNSDVYNFLQSNAYPEYTSSIHRLIPSTLGLIDDQKIERMVKNILGEGFTIENSELHFLPPDSPPIPLHQDNFYHCINQGLGLKILIPLTPLDLVSGALVYKNCRSSLGVLPHQASTTKNFSSSISPKNELLKSLSETYYSYVIGDASYHLLNSMHYSYGNKSERMSYFLVFRFHACSAVLNPCLQQEYNQNLQQHKRLIN